MANVVAVTIDYRGVVFSDVPVGYKYIAVDGVGGVFLFSEVPLYDSETMSWISYGSNPLYAGHVLDIDPETSLEEIY